MAETLHREFVYLWYYFELQLGQIFPYWVLGMVLGSAVSVFLKERIHGTIPIAVSFSKSGIRDDWLAAFMMSSILLNPQLIIYSTALGTVALTVRILSCFLCGVLAGLLLRWFYKGKGFFERSGFYDYRACYEDNQSWGGKNCSWYKKISAVLRICYGVFLYNRAGGESVCPVTKTKRRMSYEKDNSIGTDCHTCLDGLRMPAGTT